MLYTPTEMLTADRPVQPGENGLYGTLTSPFSGQSQPLAQALQRCVYRSLGGNAEVLEKVLGRRACPETVHTDELAIVADHGIPAPAHGGLDRDLDRRLADQGLQFVFRLRQHQFERRHRDHPAAMPFSASCFWASTAIWTSEPVANSETFASPCAAISS